MKKKPKDYPWFNFFKYNLVVFFMTYFTILKISFAENINFPALTDHSSRFVLVKITIINNNK